MKFSLWLSPMVGTLYELMRLYLGIGYCHQATSTWPFHRSCSVIARVLYTAYPRRPPYFGYTLNVPALNSGQRIDSACLILTWNRRTKVTKTLSLKISKSICRKSRAPIRGGFQSCRGSLPGTNILQIRFRRTTLMKRPTRRPVSPAINVLCTSRPTTSEFNPFEVLATRDGSCPRSSCITVHLRHH